jgi:hypothetical protein
MIFIGDAEFIVRTPYRACWFCMYSSVILGNVTSSKFQESLRKMLPTSFSHSKVFAVMYVDTLPCSSACGIFAQSMICVINDKTNTIMSVFDNFLPNTR